MTAANCNHCRDEAHNQKLLERARKMSSQSGASWEGESFIFEYVIFILRKPVCKIWTLPLCELTPHVSLTRWRSFVFKYWKLMAARWKANEVARSFKYWNKRLACWRDFFKFSLSKIQWSTWIHRSIPPFESWLCQFCPSWNDDFVSFDSFYVLCEPISNVPCWSLVPSHMER